MSAEAFRRAGFIETSPGTFQVPPELDPTLHLETELRVDDIIVEGRHRADLGDIKSLAASIADIGLIQPVVVTPDRQLVAGQRRLAAVKSLGWETVPVVVIHTLADAADRLVAERDENTCRKDFTASEMVALGRKLEELERPKASERQGTRTDLTCGPTEPQVKHRALDAVGDALGISRGTYERLKLVDNTTRDLDPELAELARDQMAKLDAGETSARAAERVITEKKRGFAPPPATMPQCPEPTVKRRRRPLPEVFEESVSELGRLTKRFETVTSDDRFEKNADQMAHRVSDLIRARDALQRVIDKFSN
jgi:ParB-like chromosome segregation protein Spo0J